jgi:hypothetical protein
VQEPGQGPDPAAKPTGAVEANKKVGLTSPVDKSEERPELDHRGYPKQDKK